MMIRNRDKELAKEVLQNVYFLTAHGPNAVIFQYSDFWLRLAFSQYLCVVFSHIN